MPTLYEQLVNLALQRPELTSHIARIASVVPTEVTHANLSVQGVRTSAVALQRVLMAASEDWCEETGHCRAHLGIPRSEMPQIDARRVPVFVAMLRDRGVVVRSGRLPVGDLRATQREISSKKVEGMVSSARSGDDAFLTKVPVIVSSDHYIMDGHHRWAACVVLDPDMRMPVRRVGMPIKELLEVARTFKDVAFKDIKDKDA